MINHKILLLLIVGFLVFSPTFFNGFVMDDQGLILKNLNVHSIGNLFNFFRGSIFDYGGSLGGIYYRPMMTTYFSLIYTFFGSNSFFYHLAQLSLHISTSILVFILLKKYFKEITAYVIAIIFLIHPIQAETVSYNAAIQDILFVFFGLIFLIKLDDKRSGFWNAVPYGYLMLSVFSKETGFLFVPLGLLATYFKRPKEFLVNLSLSIGVFLFYVFMRFFVAKMMIHTTDEFPMMRLGLLERAQSIPEIILYYFKTFVFPLNLVSVQSWTIKGFESSHFIIPTVIIIIGIISFGFIALKLWRKTASRNLLVFFTAWLIFGMLLHIQIVPLDLTVSDRWFYFPIIGLLGVLGVLFEAFKVDRIIQSRKLLTPFIVLLTIILSIYAIRTFVRVLDWKDSKTLALHDLKIQKDNYQLLSTLGAMYLEEKNYNLAAKYSKESVEIFPHWGTSYYNLGVSYHLGGQIKSAEDAYIKAIKNAPANNSAYENLAILYIYNYNPQKARDYAKESLRKFPQSAKLWHVLALSEQKLGNDAASTEAARMLQLLQSSTGSSQ